MPPPRPTTHSDLVGQAIRALQSGQTKAAERTLKSVLRDDAENYDALLAMGVLCGQRGDVASAVKFLAKAVRRRPRSPEALYNLGQALIGQNRYAEAAEILTRAAAEASTPQIHEKLGDCLVQLERRAEAVVQYRRTLSMAPANSLARSSAVETMRKICDWSGLRELEDGLAHAAAAGAPVEPLLLQHVRDDPGLQRRGTESYWSAMIAPTAPPAVALPGPRNGDKIRVGYLSYDFRRHPMVSVIAEMIEMHDRSRIECIGFSYGPDDASPQRRRMQQAFDRFVDIRTLSDQQSVKRIAETGLDILVDLAGYTAAARLGIVAARPAPVVCHYMGYPGTLGSPAYDYLIADPVVAPPGADPDYTEALVRLPHCYWAVDRKRTPAPPARRSDHGLRDDAVVLSSLNGQQKLSPELFDVWARILAAVPHALLWLYADTAEAIPNLRAEAQARGIAERLVIAPRVSADEHLARVALADLALDVFPYGGHTTTCDALWMGVPVLALEGRAFASRVGASLLRNAGLPELVMPSLADYEREAIALARDPVRRTRLRATLAANHDTCPLFDTPAFTRSLEAAYRGMVERHRAGVAPAAFEVAI